MERKYKLRYEAETSDAARAIKGLSTDLATLDSAALNASEALDDLSKNERAGRSAVKSVALPKSAVDGLKEAATHLGTIGATDVVLAKVARSIQLIRFSADDLRNLYTAGRQLKFIGEQNTGLHNVAMGVQEIGNRAKVADLNAENLSNALNNVATKTDDIGRVREAMQGVQRTTYGARMNMEDLNKAMDKVASNGAKMDGVGATMRGMGVESRSVKASIAEATVGAGGFKSAILELAGGLTVLEALRRAVGGVGDAIKDARSKALEGAESAIRIKDQFREVANLRGLPSPDNALIKDVMDLRVASGMSMSDANVFLRGFEGALPAGRDKGNITAETAKGVMSLGGALGVRTGMDLGTAGKLSAMLANYGPIKSPDQAAGLLGTIVDHLNAGVGDLTPLSKSLMNVAGTTVGPKGSAFANLGELAATISVASNYATPSMAGTMVSQTLRGMSRSGSADANAMLDKLGITGSDDFLTRVEKFAPWIKSIESAGKNPMDALRDAGFGNITDRRGIVTFARNAGLLASRMGDVRKAAGADGTFSGSAESTLAKNAKFLDDESAQVRIGDAMKERAEFEVYKEGVPQQIERRKAEAWLKESRMIDTWDSNIMDSISGLFGLGEFLGFPNPRQSRIDAQVERMSKLRAAKPPTPPPPPSMLTPGPPPAPPLPGDAPSMIPDDLGTAPISEPRPALPVEEASLFGGLFGLLSSLLGETRRANEQRAEQVLMMTHAPLDSRRFVYPERA